MGGAGVALPFLTLALDGSEWSASHPDHFKQEEKAPVCTEKGTGLDAVE
jgi:hypothetical protein